MAQRTRPRGPGLLYSIVAVVALIALVSVVLSSSQPPPPTIAEFSPQATEVITEADVRQGSGAGAGEQAACGDACLPGEGPPLLPNVDVPRVRQCVGDPPRQIEDPQSPPCVPYWQGDNGGATYKGVTADEVRIAIPLYNSNLNLQSAGYYETMQAFFNRRFEFYGRQLRLVPAKNSDACATSRASAAEVDEEMKAFGSASGAGCAINYYFELARRKLVSAGWNSQGYFDSEMDKRKPYVWSYLMNINRIQANLGEWACKRLAGRKASHAGDPFLREQSRIFGVIAGYNSGAPFTWDSLTRELDRCGQKPVVVDFQYGAQTGGAVNPQAYENALLQMRQEGVTSVICLCVHLAFGQSMRAATSQGYFPEWLISSFEDIDNNSAVKTFAQADSNQAQLANTFGITSAPKQVLPNDMPVSWAIKEVNPQLQYQTPGQRLRFASYWYENLMQLASGVQMAGPTLTSQTFARGLQTARFPNPQHPIMAGAVGFLDGDFSMTDDSAEIWWSNTATSPYPDERAGGYCYVAKGQRHRAGQWPRGGDPFFTGTCDSGVTPGGS